MKIPLDKLNTILLLVVFILILLFQLLLSVNNERNYSLLSVQNELKRLSDDNKILYLKIETHNDLEEIERVAINKLGMIFPKKIIYINE